MNYEQMERDFIERTIALLDQYETIRTQFEQAEQYNHTLLINCLLGIIVLPKEKHLSYVPTDRITKEISEQYGLFKSKINGTVKSLRDLLIQLRHSIAHFNLNCLSFPEGSKTIDYIQFEDSETHQLIVEFDADELLPFTKNIAKKIIDNLDNYKYRN